MIVLWESTCSHYIFGYGRLAVKFALIYITQKIHLNGYPHLEYFISMTERRKRIVQQLHFKDVLYNIIKVVLQYTVDLNSIKQKPTSLIKISIHN